MSRRLIPTTTSPYWIEHARRHREEEKNRLLAEQQEEQDRLDLVPLEPCRIPPECRTPIVIKPGSPHAAAAYRAGREDEYIDATNGRFGGEW
jgi:hypothetical protein